MSYSARGRRALATGRLLLVAAFAVALIPAPASAQALAAEAPGSAEHLTQDPQPPRQALPRRLPSRRSAKAADPEAKRRQDMEFLDRVAAKLGVSREQLTGAIRGARIDQINRAVAEGKLSREQADRMIEKLTVDLDSTAPAPAGAGGQVKPGSREATPVADISVSFKLDPRLTQGLYMGERWVSTPTYTAFQSGNTLAVDAQAHGNAANGRPLDVIPEWTPADPEMVVISPARGREVKIIVQRPGQSTFTVAAGGVSRELLVKATATHEGKGIQVEISAKTETEREPRSRAASRQ